MMQTPFDSDNSVNSVIQSRPQTLPVFNRLGIDTCCGAGVSLAEAALKAGITFEVLIERLGAAAGDPAAGLAGQSCCPIERS